MNEYSTQISTTLQMWPADSDQNLGGKTTALAVLKSYDEDCFISLLVLS